MGATVSHGNLVLIGTEAWGNVSVGSRPSLTPEGALSAGFAYVAGRRADDVLWKAPTLEFLPYAPPDRVTAYAAGSAIGSGYAHWLAWSFGFERTTEAGRWEVFVDAGTGEVLSFRNTEMQSPRRIKGGVYPLTNTEVCPSATKCGEMQPDYPMPWANYSSGPPVLYTDGAGVFDSASPATTTLSGKYARVSNLNCGTINVSASTGDIDLGGTNGDHNCISGGNSPAACTAFYEVGRITEIARGWLPSNTWLQGTGSGCARTPVFVRVNHGITTSRCASVYSPNSVPSSIRFSLPFTCLNCGTPPTAVPGSACRNLGEIANVVAHEWGHALDENDLSCTGSLSNPSEAYADIAAMYRHQVSCYGYGAQTTNTSVVLCEPPEPVMICAPETFTDDSPYPSTGCNAREDQTWACGGLGNPHCDTDCSGFRDADWEKHADGSPDNPQDAFVCTSCISGNGPCGREVHCAGAPVTQAAWDLATRDLRASPFNYSSDTAFIIASKLFYQGSTNIGAWYACDCLEKRADGCGALSGYQQWLAADDDNGNLLDGTPHMTAIHAAFQRHMIACAPNKMATADVLIGPGSVLTEDGYVDTWTSNDVREILQEGLDDSVSRLAHAWRFDDLTPDVPHTLILEGHRPSNEDGDDFQFSWSNDGVTYTEIPGAVINSPVEVAGGLLYPFGGYRDSTVFIKVLDTDSSGKELDTVHIDFLAIGENLPVVQNSGCAAGPTLAPTLTVFGGPSSDKTLSWTVVPGATRYWVFRTEGHAGCNLGKALIAQVSGTSYADTEVAEGRQYFYVVMAAGTNNSCFGPASECQASPTE